MFKFQIFKPPSLVFMFQRCFPVSYCFIDNCRDCNIWVFKIEYTDRISIFWSSFRVFCLKPIFHWLEKFYQTYRNISEQIKVASRCFSIWFWNYIYQLWIYLNSQTKLQWFISIDIQNSCFFFLPMLSMTLF